MERAVDNFGRIVVPKQMLEQLNVEPGEYMEVVLSDGKIILRKSTQANSTAGNTAQTAQKEFF